MKLLSSVDTLSKQGSMLVEEFSFNGALCTRYENDHGITWVLHSSKRGRFQPKKFLTKVLEHARKKVINQTK